MTSAFTAVSMRCLLVFLATTAAFKIPLDVVSVTPSTDSAAVVSPDAPPTPVALSNRDAVTVTFSRAVIALGSDFGPGALPPNLTPFTLDPPVAGHLRWVTTSIARFDPAAEWPPELELTLSLNPSLATYDGAKFATSSQQWQFTTPQLRISSARVRSEAALRLTNGTWSSTAHPLARGAHEVPPDGRIVLWFSADVELPLLQASLKLHRTTAEAHGLEPSPAPDAETDDGAADDGSHHHSNPLTL